MTAADDVPRCEWSAVCRLWPGHRLVRVQYRNAPVEHVAVCDDHLPHALAKGFTHAAGGAWHGAPR